jgi:hypothetical protein
VFVTRVPEFSTGRRPRGPVGRDGPSAATGNREVVRGASLTASDEGRFRSAARSLWVACPRPRGHGRQALHAHEDVGMPPGYGSSPVMCDALTASRGTP